MLVQIRSSKIVLGHVRPGQAMLSQVRTG